MKEKQISLYGLLKRVCLAWKELLVITVVCGLLGGCFSYYRQMKAINNSAASEETAEPAAEMEGMAYNGAEVSKTLTKHANALSEYANNSVIREMQNTAYVAVGAVYYNGSSAGADNDAATAEALTLSLAISDVVEHGIDYSPMAEKAGLIDERYIKELVVAEPRVGSCLIKVYYNNDSVAEEVLNYIFDSLKKQIVVLQGTYGQFSYDLVSLGVSKTFELPEEYENWAVTQATAFNDLANVKTTLDKNEGTLNSISSSKKSSGSRNLTVSRSAVIKMSVVFAILGFFVSFFVVALRAITQECVLDAEDINRIYSLSSLGVFPIKSWKGKPVKGAKEKIINSGRNNLRFQSEEDKYRYVIDRINREADSSTSSQMAVVGDASKECMEKICSHLNQYDQKRQYVLLKDIDADMNTYKQLSECREAVLVVSEEDSRYDQLDKIVKTLNGKDLRIIGTISA